MKVAVAAQLDAEQDRKRQTLRALLWPGIAANVVLSATAPFINPNPTTALAIYIPALCMQVVVLRLADRGRVELGGAIIALFAFLAALGSLFNFGIRGPAPIGFMVAVLFAGFTWRRRAAVVFALLGVLSLLAMVLLQQGGLYEAHRVATEWRLFFGGSVALLISALLIFMAQREASDATQRASVSESRYGDLVAQSPDGILMLAADDRIVSINPAAKGLLEVDADAAIGQQLGELPGIDHAEITRVLTGFRSRGRESLSSLPLITFTRRTSDRRLLELSGREHGVARASREMHLTLRDVTRREQTNDRLARTARLESLGQLAGGVAHDFNNLLTVIMSGAGMLAAGRSTDDSKDVATNILEASERAAALTRQLLSFSRKQVLEPRVLSVNSTIRSLHPMLRSLSGDSVELRLKLEEKLPSVRADPSELERAIVNLCVNSCGAMPRGGKLTIATSVSHEDAHEASPAGSYVNIVVSDEGEGMGAEVLERIFEPFFTTKPGEGGSGLGLAIVHGFVQQSTGRISVRSTVGEGTTFTVALPAVYERPEPADKAAKQAQPPGNEGVLLVEDDELVRNTVEAVLVAGGYAVTVAPHAKHALGVLRAGGEFELMITDIAMPEMTGIELSKHARELRPNLPVLYISGYAADDNLLVDREDARVAFLEKPFTPAALTERVAELLSGSRRG